MKKYIYRISLATSTLFAPVLASAVTTAPFGGLKGFLVEIKKLLGDVIPLLVALAIIYFFWGLVQFLKNAGDVKTHEDGKNKIIWGLLAIFVMLSIAGILELIGSTLGLDTGILVAPTL